MPGVKSFKGPMEFCPGFKQLQNAYQNTAGLIMGMGTSTLRVKTAVADSRFLDYNFENTATSGDNRGMYLRLYHSGTGGGGEAARIFTTVNNVVGGTAHGAHVSLNFGTTGKLTGLGVANRCTLHIPNQAMSGGGNYTPLQTEIYSDGASSDPAGMAELSYLRVVNDGNASGKADVDDDASFFALNGFTSATGNMYYGSTIRVDCEGNTRYLVLSTAEDSLTMAAPVTIGVDGTGHDVTFYGDTAGTSFLWDQSEDNVTLTSVRTITGEDHALDVNMTGTLGSGEGMVAGNFVATTAGTAGAWASGVYAKVVQGATKNVNGYLSAAEFEVINGADNVSDWFVLVLNSQNNGAQQGSHGSYIALRDYGSLELNSMFWFGDHGSSIGTKSDTVLLTTFADGAHISHAIRFYIGSTPYWILCSSQAPSGT